jgi:hypothetical protein
MLAVLERLRRKTDQDQLVSLINHFDLDEAFSLSASRGNNRLQIPEERKTLPVVSPKQHIHWEIGRDSLSRQAMLFPSLFPLFDQFS